MTTATKNDTSYHDRRLQGRIDADPEFKAEYERFSRQVQQIDAVVNQLDAMRESAGISKAELARMIGKNPASIRRLFSSAVNPELKTVAAIADALDAEVVVQPRKPLRRSSRTRKAGRAAAEAREKVAV